jgi:putative OPT family oligopeptide transporter
MSEAAVLTRLPENAYRELKPGEVYTPMVPAAVQVPEVTGRSIAFGIIMNVVFSMAATYLALKVGQGIETAIPISILAVGLSGFLARQGRRASSLLENVNALAISTTSGIVAGGTVFTMPAIYILRLHEKLGTSDTALFFQILLIPCFGAALGVLFLIPFRRYFVKEMHGRLPFPEATATNEILATGASESGGQAWVLIYSFLFGAFYNWLASAMKVFGEVFTTSLIPRLHDLTHKVKAVFFLGTGAELLGLGFIIGLRYASIICAGSFLSWFVIIPLLAPLGLDQLKQLNANISGVEAEAIFRAIPRNIGIGGIFAAGLISILKMSKVIATALRQALGGLFAAKGGDGRVDRTDEDISYPTLVVIGLVVTLAMGVYFRVAVMGGMEGATRLTIVSVLLALGAAFLFTTVSAWAIAMISTTPISGMTVTTLIITAVVLLAFGLPKSEAGMLAVLMVGGVVASALSMAGTLVTEFKIGYWMGASPRRIEWSALLALVLASVLVTATIMFLSRKGFDQTISKDALSAPQANVMASALKSFVGGGSVPWLMYGTGVVISIIVTMLGISGLAFALGMYLPMELNTPILVGAIVAHLVARSSRDEKLAKARSDKGILVASGLIAGGAICGVLISVLTAVNDEYFKTMDPPSDLMNWLQIPPQLVALGWDRDGVAGLTNWLGLFMFLGLAVLAYLDCRRARPAPAAAP